MINLSLQCCLLNFNKCSTLFLSEIVHVLKAVAIVTFEHLNFSTIFVVSHILSATTSPEWRLNLGFGTHKKCPFPQNRSVPSIEVTNTKIL